MQPEISRRCSACGAAVRASATFCHQCGKPANRTGPVSGGLSGERGEESRPAEADVGPERAHSAVAAQSAGGEPASAVAPGKDAGPPAVAVEEHAPSRPPVDAAESDSSSNSSDPITTRARLHRARGAVEEKLGSRVEKIRQTSSVVLDEAADDPSLRFLLIAVVLFILFLVLLFITRLLE